MIDPDLLAQMMAQADEPVMGFIGALIGAGASLIGGILNKNSAKKQQREAQEFAKENSITDMVKLRDMAEKAGFNPLTALQAGAGSPAASNYQSTFNPALSSGGFIAEAIQRGADTYFNSVAEKDRQAETLRREAEDKRRWEAEMAQKAAPRFGYALTDQQAYSPPQTVRFARVGSAAMTAEPSPSDGSVSPSKLPIIVDGKEFRPSGQHSDAEAAESRYGEIAGEVLGTLSWTHDLGRNARRAFNGAVLTNKGTPVTTYQGPKAWDDERRDPYAYQSPYGGSGPNRGSW